MNRRSCVWEMAIVASSHVDVFAGVSIAAARLTPLLRVAARQAAGFFRTSQRIEVIRVEGDNELAVGFANVGVQAGDGTLLVTLPVRCDQIGKGTCASCKAATTG